MYLYFIILPLVAFINISALLLAVISVENINGATNAENVNQLIA